MIKFEKVSEENRKATETIYIPERATSGSAGYDFKSPIDITISKGEKVLIWTNIKAKMNSNYVLKIYPRSSMAIKNNIILKNIVPIIDSDYYDNQSTGGNIGICLLNTGDKDFEIKQGDKICQGIFSKYLTTDNDNTQGERTGGFGSTGVK